MTISFRNGKRWKVLLGIIVSMLAIAGTVWGSARIAVADIAAGQVRAELLSRTSPDDPEGLVKRYELTSYQRLVIERLDAQQKQLDRIEGKLDR